MKNFLSILTLLVCLTLTTTIQAQSHYEVHAKETLLKLKAPESPVLQNTSIQAFHSEGIIVTNQSSLPATAMYITYAPSDQSPIKIVNYTIISKTSQGFEIQELSETRQKFGNQTISNYFSKIPAGGFPNVPRTLLTDSWEL